MAIGFDLTQFGDLPKPKVVPSPARPAPPVQQVQQQAPVQQSPAPDAPRTMEEALHRPVNTTMVNEDGTPFVDKLARKAPHIKRETWQIDKFTEPDGLPRDKEGNVMIRAPQASEKDKEQINHE